MSWRQTEVVDEKRQQTLFRPRPNLQSHIWVLSERFARIAEVNHDKGNRSRDSPDDHHLHNLGQPVVLQIFDAELSDAVVNGDECGAGETS